MAKTSYDRLYEPPEENLGADDFLVESHQADAMPAAHWHDHLEINWVPKGRIDYLMNGRRVSLLPRRYGVFWAAMNHQTISVQEDQIMYCAYIPIGNFLALPIASEFRSAVLAGGLIQSSSESPEDGYRLEDMASRWGEADTVVQQIWREEILLRLRRMSVEPRQHGLLEEGDLATGRRATGVRHVEQMTTFIQDNLAKQITVTEIAEHTGLHPTNAQVAFRRVLGMTIAKYLRRQRLSHAMRLLAETDYGISEIAYRSGYSSLTRLYDAFKTHLGRTPKAYRATMRGD
ncbi:MAG: helix-turn-helix domain-containing protein [Pseudoruegeria sp.]